MKLKIPCPRCGHPQPFGRRKREIGPDKYEVYIQCKKCRWEEVVISGDSDKLLNEREIEKLKVRAAKDPSLKKVLYEKLKKRE